MTEEQIAKKIAELAWEVQPKFRQRFNTVEELARRILAGYRRCGTFGWFLTLCIIETYCTVDELKTTVAHAELDEVMGITTVDQSALDKARATLAGVSQILPMFDQHCEAWINGDLD